ncbi:hypothetical protein D3C84_518940 [compost metagenome]
MQHPPGELLVALHVSRGDLQHEVLLTRHVPEIHHLGFPLQAGDHLIDDAAVIPLQGHQHQHGDGPAHGGRGHQRHLPLDEARLPQRPDAAVTGGRREADPVGQLGNGQTGILLQFGEDEQIKFVGHGAQEIKIIV